MVKLVSTNFVSVIKKCRQYVHVLNLAIDAGQKQYNAFVVKKEKETLKNGHLNKSKFLNLISSLFLQLKKTQNFPFKLYSLYYAGRSYLLN